MKEKHEVIPLCSIHKKLSIHNHIKMWQLLHECSDCNSIIKEYLFNKCQRLIHSKAHYWKNKGQCRYDICLSYNDLVSIANETFINCLNSWDGRRSSFTTFFWKVLNNDLYGEAIGEYPPIEELKEIDMNIYQGGNIENQVNFKQVIESLSNDAKFVINSTLNTPIGLIEQSLKETGKVHINKKRIQRFLVEHENWSIYSCRRVFSEIKKALEY